MFNFLQIAYQKAIAVFFYNDLLCLRNTSLIIIFSLSLSKFKVKFRLVLTYWHMHICLLTSITAVRINIRHWNFNPPTSPYWRITSVPFRKYFH